jgi:Ca2+:H+ antiporter
MTSTGRTVERASSISSIESNGSSTNNHNNTDTNTTTTNHPNMTTTSKVRYPSVGEVALGLVTHTLDDYGETATSATTTAPSTNISSRKNPTFPRPPPPPITTLTNAVDDGHGDYGDIDDHDDDVGDDDDDDGSSTDSNKNHHHDRKNRTQMDRTKNSKNHRRRRRGGGGNNTPTMLHSPTRRNRTFYGQAEHIGGGTTTTTTTGDVPASSTIVPPGPPIGAAGTFRSKALTRRYVNSSRRNLMMKQNQGMSTKSLLSTTSNEGTPLLLVSPTAASAIDKSLREGLNLSIQINTNTNNEKANNTNSEGMTSTVGPDNVESRTTATGGVDGGHDDGDGDDDDDNNNNINNNKKNTIGMVMLEEDGKTIWGHFRDIWFGKPISVFLLVVPLALLSHYLQWSAQWVFWLNFFAMIPLAATLGDFTEEAALHTNDTIGGLLNATFGNAVEVVVAIQALLVNEIRVVQASMIGSIFSNLLLVLGMCFFCGGIYYKEQTFNTTSATASMGLLALGSIAMVLPTPFAMYYDVQDEHVLIISRLAACFLLFMYLQLLFFQLYTHKHIFDEIDGQSLRQNAPVANVTINNLNGTTTTNTEHSNNGVDADNDVDDEEPRIPMWMALFGLFLTTAAVTVFSDILVGSIDEFCKDSGISRTFVGLIILPIVGNAVEHVSAVTVAMKNKMDLAMGVALGSCTQISLFVVPLTVLVGWATDKPMSLNFPHFEIILYVMSIFTVSVCLANPRCNWLEGSLLCTTYLMIAIGFWFEEVVDF